MAQMMTAIRRLVLRDNGQDLLEYGLLVALIALVCIVGVSTVGTTISNVFWSGIGQAV
jgi:pilus assembly protein Flp/PilA